jgi:uncharacterized protein YbjT (DUF2867 family)
MDRLGPPGLAGGMTTADNSATPDPARSGTFLVIGGTGTTGRRVAARLTALGLPVRVGSRGGDPRFDWHDPAGWDRVLDGVTALYLVPLDGERLTRPFLARAGERGVRRVVLLSGRGADIPGYLPGDNPLGTTHLDGEAALRESGLAWTVLRPGWFTQNFTEGFFAEAVRTGELRLPAGDGAVPFVDAEDIAAVAVAALTGEGHTGRAYELSGPRALTFAQAAAELSAASGRPLRYVPVSVAEFVRDQTASGVPEPEARWTAELFAPILRGEEERLSAGVRQALGREPRDFADALRAPGPA